MPLGRVRAHLDLSALRHHQSGRGPMRGGPSVASAGSASAAPDTSCQKAGLKTLIGAGLIDDVAKGGLPGCSLLLRGGRRPV